MAQAAGWTIVAVSSALLVLTALGLRSRMASTAVDGLVALGGAGLAIGGLLTLNDVEIASWIVAPIAVAAFTIVHVRALFAGSGPFRT